MLVLLVVSVFVALGVWFTRYLVASDRGHKEPVGALWGAFGFGALGVIGAIVLETLVIPKDLLTHASAFSASQVAFSALMVGIIEEACKFLPLAFYLYKKPYFDEHTDGVLYFAIAGLGFGLPENIFYSFTFGAAVGVERLVLTLIFHSATTAIAGYYLARHKLDHTSALSVVGGLGVAMGIHAVYDFGLLSGRGMFVLVSLATTFGLSAYLFVLLKKSKRADVVMGLSSDGNNTFCRVCGAPNPKHNLYCAHCGNRA